MSETTYGREQGSSRSEVRPDGSVAQFSDPVEGVEEPATQYVHETGVPEDVPVEEVPVEAPVATTDSSEESTA